MIELLKRKVKILKWTIPLWVLLVVGIFSSGAFALYIYGMSISGAFIATSGTLDVTAFDWDISITSDTELTEYFLYTNPDGLTPVVLSLDDSNITSSDIDCTYEHGKDFKMYAGNQSTEYELTAGDWNTLLQTGNTNFSLRVVPHTNRCPLTGTYIVAMNIA